MVPTKIYAEDDLSTLSAQVEELSISTKEEESKRDLTGELASLCICSRAVNLIRCPEDVTIEVITFREIRSLYEPIFVILDSNHNLYYATAYLKECIARSKNLTGVFFDEKSGMYYAENIGDIIFTFKRIGTYDKSGHKAAIIVDFKGVSFVDPERITENGLEKYEEIPDGLIPKKLLVLEKLMCNTTYTLDGISKYTFKGKQKYKLKIGSKYYKSNYWLEQNLQTFNYQEGIFTYDVLVRAGVKSKIQTLAKDATPQRKMELRCHCL
jgi:hypothetical protein